MSTAVIFQIESLIVFSLLTFGIFKRRQRNLHVKTMYTAIVWDILLILQIELNRGAILKASKALENPFLLNFHVAIALLSVVGYCFLMYSGRKILNNDTSIRPWHKKIGFSTYILRLAVLITSYFVVIPKN
jgi:hydrogenase/urease accessory protein HupE